METIARQRHYFSAYPLKTLEKAMLESKNDSPYLQSLISGKTSSSTRIRVSPMTNPYTKPISALPLRLATRKEEIK